MENNKILFWAFIDAVGTFIYVALVAWLLFNGGTIFGQVHSFAAPLMLLMLFIVSAIITGSLVLARPAYLYFNGFKKEGINLVLATVLFLFIFTLLVFIFLLL